jgi:hypothetical protein
MRRKNDVNVSKPLKGPFLYAGTGEAPAGNSGLMFATAGQLTELLLGTLLLDETCSTVRLDGARVQILQIST